MYIHDIGLWFSVNSKLIDSTSSRTKFQSRCYQRNGENFYFQSPKQLVDYIESSNKKVRGKQITLLIHLIKNSNRIQSFGAHYAFKSRVLRLTNLAELVEKAQQDHKIEKYLYDQWPQLQEIIKKRNTVPTTLTFKFKGSQLKTI